MKTLTVNELRTALKTAPHTKDGSGLPTRDQLKTALALVHHSLAHRKAAEAWFHVVYGQPSKELVWFEQSGHNPMGDEPARFKSLLINRLLAVRDKEKNV